MNHELLGALFSFFSCVGSFIAAGCSIYEISEPIRHMRHIEEKDYDVIMIPKQKYSSLTESEFQENIMDDKGCEWLDGTLRCIEIDGKNYIAANLNWDKALESKLTAQIRHIRHFDSFYVTKQGKWNGKDVL